MHGMLSICHYFNTVLLLAERKPEFPQTNHAT